MRFPFSENPTRTLFPNHRLTLSYSDSLPLYSMIYPGRIKTTFWNNCRIDEDSYSPNCEYTVFVIKVEVNVNFAKKRKQIHLTRHLM